MSIILEKSKKYIQQIIKEKPDFGILLLESQFNKLIEEVENPICISYEEIPIFHEKNLYGKFLFGKIEGKNIVFLIEPSFEENRENSIFLCKKIGIEKLILINISAGINPNYKMGDIMLVKDHINFFTENFNVKKIMKNNLFNIKELYDQKMLDIAENIAMNHNIIIQKGIYVAFPYPNYKTYAEHSMIRSMGGDCVGINILTDVLIARCINLRVFSITIIFMGLISDCKSQDKNTGSIITNNFLLNTFTETEKSMRLLILIIKEFIKFCS
ncbi:phosphorylase family protein [Blattabacterium cuenoti]|uniref:phosphorylase family protein n=1 Tax=Blattabacterium cuenoti TaxID=1653831 RepID=UPI00163BC99F|nr:purine-nucleoside phosphorylase [Blattabacterium cuenoti]